MKHVLSIAFAFALACTAATPATAQDFSLPPLVNNVGMGNIAIGAAAQSHVRKSQNTRSSLTAPIEQGALNAAPRASDFSFRSDRERTQQNLRTFVERTPEAAGRADLQKMIAAQPTIIEEIGGAMRSFGLDPHNVADAYTMWWVNAWSAAHKTDQQPNAATVAAVKQQTRSAFMTTPDFANTSDADRQEYAEALMLQALFLSAAFEQNKNNPDFLNQLADAARKGAKASGLDLSLMTLTANGFVPRTGADASEAVDGEAAHALAKDSSSEQGDDSDTSMGIALAAGAGLGIVLLAGGAILRKG